MTRYLKRRIRSFAVWLTSVTDLWVVPRSLWQAADANPELALRMLEKRRELWPDDPHIVYAETLIDFMKGD